VSVSVWPVATLITVTVAPFTAAPDGSYTVPVKLPSMVWANVGIANRAKTAKVASTIAKRLRIETVFITISPGELKLRDTKPYTTSRHNYREHTVESKCRSKGEAQYFPLDSYTYWQREDAGYY
jgi:hypothetical protein